MKELIDIKNAIRQASNEVKRKINNNKMFRSDDESPESEDFTDGDPETLFTISSLYAQFVDDDFNNACDAIFCKLEEMFPEYI